MRRTSVVIASVALVLAAGQFAVRASAASPYQQVLQLYEREGTIPSCQFTAAELQAALGGVDTYGAQYFADFTQEARAALREQVAALDDLHDLPTAFTHPDFVTANAIVPPSGGMVIVDWAGAGVAPRLWTLGFLLWSAGLSGPRHAERARAAFERSAPAVERPNPRRG